MARISAEPALHREPAHHHPLLSASITAFVGDTEGAAPGTIIQIVASGMPVISTTHCDIPEVLAPAGERFLAEEGDIDGLVDRLLALVADWNSLASTLACLRRHIELEYNLVRQGQRLVDHYQRVAGAS